MTLDKLAPGNCALITAVEGDNLLRCRLLDMGFTPGTPVLMREAAPLGDPMRLSLRGYELALRRKDARGIICRLEVE